jgi:indolepyruvate ferredoxin oxidoreductase
MSLDEVIAHRTQLLTEYQNAAYAAHYRSLVDQVRKVAFDGGYGEALPRAVAINYAKLLAYKDEYEVARLYTDGTFAENLAKQFEGDFKISFNLAPPILQSGVDAQGRPKKRVFGAWMLPVFRTLAKFRFLRGTLFDPFSYSEDRKLERNLIKGYEQDVVTAVKLLSPKTHDIAVELLSLPDQIRGYGPVKDASVAKAKTRYEQLARDLVDPPPLVAPQIAAE